jgi:hypothetical protein
MKTVHGTMLGLALAIGCSACCAQDATIPIRQIERDAQLSATAAIPPREAGVSRSYALPSGSSSSASFVFVPPAPKAPRTLSRRFFLLNGLHLGMATFDVVMTQHCIADHHCQEGNPIMPSSYAGQLGVDFALVGYGAFISYELKKRENNLWWLSPSVGVAAHTAGVATGFAHY